MSKSDAIFTVSYEQLMWRVTLDGKPFGDYRSKQNALRGIEDARYSLETNGRRAKVVIGAERVRQI